MMRIVAEVLWLRLHAALSAFAEKLAVTIPSVICDIGCTQNEAFLLRAYLAIRRGAGDDEMSIAVDARGDGKQMTIESDACIDDGTVVAAGPSAAIQLPKDGLDARDAVDDWMREFERFLSENEPEVVAAVSRLA